MKKIYYCVDCKKELTATTPIKRCWDCYVLTTQIPENNPNFKGGIWTKKYYCKDCKVKEITSYTALYGKGRCHSCDSKLHKPIRLTGENNPNWKGGFIRNKCMDCNKPINIYVKRCQECYFKHLKGNKNPNWKGGITSIVRIIRNSDEYINWRNQVFERDNYTCLECKQIGNEIHAHHDKDFHILVEEFLQYYNQFSPIEDKETLIRLAITWQPFWNIDNGKTLCKKCHQKIPTRRLNNGN